ncbi:metallophosphoesterase family protein, partial [Microbispora rosea]
MKVVVLADTHAPRRWKSCPPAVAAHLRGADLILHAGDVCTADVLVELSAYAPVHAVLGNNDGPDVAAHNGARQLCLRGRARKDHHGSGLLRPAGALLP